MGVGTLKGTVLDSRPGAGHADSPGASWEAERISCSKFSPIGHSPALRAASASGDHDAHAPWHRRSDEAIDLIVSQNRRHRARGVLRGRGVRGFPNGSQG